MEKWHTLKCQYVGETGRRVVERFSDHKGYIIQPCHNNTTTPLLGQHFCLPGHTLADLEFLPFEHTRSGDPEVRRARERMYINKFDLVANGLNRKL